MQKPPIWTYRIGVKQFKKPSTPANVSEQAAQQFNADELWRDNENVRESVRPVLADVGETAQFLAAKRLTLTPDARTLFLDFLYGDLGEALKRLERISEGDYRPTNTASASPSRSRTDTGVTREVFAEVDCGSQA